MRKLVLLLTLVTILSAATLPQPPTNPLLLNITTQCNTVDLSAYNYSSIVRSGYLSVGKNNSVLSFIFYGKQDASQQDLNNYPTIIWLNGGPGESSQRINLNEVGPLLVSRKFMDLSLFLIQNKFAWNRNYNLLFVDQPIGAGLSYADTDAKNPIPTTSDGVAKDFYKALDELYNNQNGCFNSNKLGIRASSPLYIFGQEYGGKFAPAIAAEITSNKESGGWLTGLRGVGIADGLTNPLAVLSEVGNYAYHMSLIDYRERMVVEQLLINATVNLESRMLEEAHNSFKRIMDYIVEKSGNVNVFKHSKFGNYDDLTGELFHNISWIDKFNLNRQIRYEMQSDQVYLALYEDFLRAQAHQVEYLLSKNVGVLVYTGQQDLMVHAPGTMKWIDRINYADADAFRNSVLDLWKVNGKIAGTTKSAGKLQLNIVFNAGRYVAMDQPEFAFEMVRSFIDKTKQQSPIQTK